MQECRLSMLINVPTNGTECYTTLEASLTGMARTPVH